MVNNLKRGIVIGIPVVAAGLLAILHGRSPTRPSVQIAHETIVVTNPRRDSVRVEHEWVRVSPAPPQLAAAAAPRRTPARVTRVTRRATPERTMLAKARRLIVGNGRYRPRPFPTVEER